MVRDLATFDPTGVDFALFSAGATTSRALAQKFVDAQADAPPLRLDDHDQAGLDRVASAATMTREEFVQAQHRQVVAAEREHFAVSDHTLASLLQEDRSFPPPPEFAAQGFGRQTVSAAG